MQEPERQTRAHAGSKLRRSLSALSVLDGLGEHLRPCHVFSDSGELSPSQSFRNSVQGYVRRAGPISKEIGGKTTRVRRPRMARGKSRTALSGLWAHSWLPGKPRRKLYLLACAQLQAAWRWLVAWRGGSQSRTPHPGRSDGGQGRSAGR